MRLSMIITSLLLLTLTYSVQAQTVVALDEIHHPSANPGSLHDEPVLNDEHSDAHMIWAPPGFKKNRTGAPTYEQIFVLEGEGNFTFGNDSQKVSRGSWVVIPANTSHTIEVIGEGTLKMLAIQKK